MGQFGIGQPVRRKEDVRLLTGNGCFTDDINVAGQIHAIFVRSPHAHAILRGIDARAALALPGVLHVFTQADLDADGVGPMICDVDFKDRAGNAMFKPVRKVFPTDRVRFVGEAVAMVVGETAEAARAGAEAVVVEYEELLAVTSSLRAMESAAPVLHEARGNNVAVHWENQAPDEVETLLAASARRVHVELVNNRVAVVPMEPRAALAEFESGRDRVTLHAPTQGVRTIHGNLGRRILHWPEDKFRVVSPDTGGGFGIRSKLYPELVVLVWAARRLRHSIKWRADRAETFVSDYHGRDQVNRAEMGFDKEGRITALKVETILNVGAYASDNGPRLPINGGGRIIPCGYDITKFYLSVKPVYTNTVCTDTYRGAGRPEANYLMERLMDLGAQACGLTRDEIRRRNVILPDQMPYRTQMGMVIDSGDFIGNMDMAMKAADWQGFAERRKATEARGKLRGIGIANLIEQAGGRPTEEMRVRIEPDGSATIFSGTFSHGQGHETVYSQLVHEYLGIPFDRIGYVQGDTDLVPKGAVGTFGSRSSMVGGVAIRRATTTLVEKGKRIAGHLMQTDVSRVTFESGVFRAGAASVRMADVARAAADRARLPDGMEPGLDESCLYERDAELMNYPNGCHVCEVEVDPDLGLIDIVNYIAVDDCGVVLNPFIVHGQVYGGVAQGIGQAMTEEVLYDDDSGQMLSASFMDYGMPRAHHMPHIEALFNVVPCKTNDIGVKGAGEAGACGAPSALVSAVVDALRPFGVGHIDMPLTPERVWRAIEDGRAHSCAPAQA